MSEDYCRTGLQVKGLVRGSDHTKGQCMLTQGRGSWGGLGVGGCRKRGKETAGHPSSHSHDPRFPSSHFQAGLRS